MKSLVLNALKVIASACLLLALVVALLFAQRIYTIFNPPVNHVLFWLNDDDVHSKLKARISSGVDVNQVNDHGRALIHLAVVYGTPESLLLLIDAGAYISTRNNFGQTALHLAVDGGSAENIRVLLRNGADVNASDKFQISPLHKAVSLGASGPTKGDNVALLLSAGADVNARNEQGETPVHWAVTSYYLEYCLVPLLKAGGNPDSINNQGETPLHLASRMGVERAVELLLEYGADVTIRDKNGNTAIDNALNLPEPFTASIMGKLRSIK